MSVKENVEKIINNAGGLDNISSVTHCSTRLRLFIKDKSKVDTQSIQEISKVLGVVFKSDELQIVLGKEVIPYYNEASKQFEEYAGSQTTQAASVKKEKKGFKDYVDLVVAFVSGAVTPMIPGLVAGGMMKVFLLLATLVWPSFEQASAYTLLSQLANVSFYFMPIFVAYGAAKKLGATTIYPMIVAGALVYPDFVNLFAEGAAVEIFGMNVMKVSYSSTLLPALLISIFAYYCEKILTKIIPGILRTVLVGMLTMGLTYVAGIVVLGPLGDIIGSYIVHIFLAASNNFGPVAIALLAACMPWLVMTGMHHAVTPFMVQAFADPGYDVFFRPAYILHNMAEGGACIGVALKTKDKAFRAECLSLAFGCIVAGVTEPALYGVNFRLKNPMIGVMAGGAAGGLVGGILGVTAYVYGYSTILALPIFQQTMLSMALAIAVDIAVAAGVTYILGFQENKKTAVKENSMKAINSNFGINACIEGKPVSIENVKDPVFSSKSLGDGIAIEPVNGSLYAPIDGEVVTVFPTGHAIGITNLINNISVLIHVGIDTVNLKGKGFETLVKQGQTVKKGDKIGEFDLDYLKREGYDPTTMMLLTDLPEDLNLEFLNKDTVSSSDIIISLN